jgi:hypothetical protein
LRNKVIIAATSAQAIYGLVNRITGWAYFLGTLNWTTTPEVPAAALANEEIGPRFVAPVFRGRGFEELIKTSFQRSLSNQ